MCAYPTDFVLAILLAKFPFITKGPSLLCSMNMEPLFKQGEASTNVTTLLEHIKFADPGSPDIDEDDRGLCWGHYQYTAGGLTLLSSLTSWQDISSVSTAFQLVAAAIKMCQDAQTMCTVNETPMMGGFLSNVYLKKTFDFLKSCWVGTGGIHLLY